MAVDIVTRLRATTTVKGWFDHSPDVVFKNNPLCYEAADEIERGRKLVEELLLSNNRWQSIAERAMEQLDIAMNLINTLQGANNG